MATLNRKGTTIQGRWRKDEDTPNDDLVSERTREYAIRSDRVILIRRGARFRAHDGYSGYLHSWGWTVYGAIKKDVLDTRTFVKRFGENLVAKGFRRVV